MNRDHEERGWLARLRERLDQLGQRPREGRNSGRGRDDQEDGPGVPVPVGPRPRRGGAQARPPAPEEAPEAPIRR